jgi:hypothetical protein
VNFDTVVEAYTNGLIELDSMVHATELEVINGSNNSLLVTNNINFFTKSFLISACAHLEMCVKDIVFAAAGDIDARLSAASVPTSIIDWRYNQKKKNESVDPSLSRFAVGMTKKEVDDLVSGNVYRTKDALALVGVDLTKDKQQWEAWKDLIQSIVTRRNGIVHHNDDASDISLGDVRVFIKGTSINSPNRLRF